MDLSQASVSRRRMSLKRVLGFSLMIFSALGLVFSLLGLLAVPQVTRPVVQSADDALALTLTALDTTSKSLDLVRDALGETQHAVRMLRSVTQNTDDGLQNTEALIDSLSDALTGDLRRVILSSQRSLSAAEEGAAVIEEMLYALNVMSPLTGATYDPDVSLTESLALINQSLDTVPQTLAEVDENLNAVQENLDSMQTGFPDLTNTLNESEAILVESQTTVDEYSRLVQALSLKISSLQENLRSWVRTTTLVLYFLLIWLAIAQIGLLYQGREMVSYDHTQVEGRVRELEEKVEKLLQQGKK